MIKLELEPLDTAECIAELLYHAVRRAEHQGESAEPSHMAHACMILMNALCEISEQANEKNQAGQAQ